MTWDADNVYVGLVVTDEYHENAAHSAWNGDSLQLMIANADRSAWVALYNYGLGGVETDPDLGANVILYLEAGLVNGNGRIERQPDRVSFTNGTIVRLRAVADPGNVFAGWDGASETNSERDVIVVANLQIEANFVPETQPAPRLDFLSTALDSEGFHLQIRGANAVQYEIQSSDDLLDWKPLMVLSGTGSISPFLDPTALTSRFRFYRVKVLP